MEETGSGDDEAPAGAGPAVAAEGDVAAAAGSAGAPGSLGAPGAPRAAETAARGVPPPGEWTALLRRRWPAVTVAVVTTGLLLGLRVGWRAELPAVLYLAVLGVLLTFVDVALMRLPDPLTLPSYPVGAVLLGIAAPFTEDGGTRCLQALAGMVLLWLFYGLQWFSLPGRLGLGDVKLAGVLGLYLGWYGLGAAIVGVALIHVLAAVYAVVLLVTRRAGLKSDLPFGPFMIMGTLAAVALYAPLG